MLLLEKYIKRRRSYTNVTNFSAKKVPLDISHTPDRHNGIKIQAHQIFSQTRVESPATNMLFPHFYSSTSNIVPQRTKMISNTNFSCTAQNKESGAFGHSQ
ncbi:uncharacterized protein LOC116850443 [Odontomachus brunneus]|uniref:uncharacterized protein LOC116850443 n=1 Tax=Odontomachus brunneus TaxID=486640 RepID=UPI0013F2A05C|nr:uncharacterized protein LOC116850443 [Odontomachus brunneus]